MAVGNKPVQFVSASDCQIMQLIFQISFEFSIMKVLGVIYQWYIPKV